MIKKPERDSQILLKLLGYQKEITAVMRDHDCDTAEEAAENKRVTDLLHFYTLQMIALTKGLTKKTKEELEFFNDIKSGMVIAAGQYAYPTVSKLQIAEYAIELSDISAKNIVKDMYAKCVGKA